ncbi:MAG: hypothetical protein BIFFINMI_02915 [Phycisphaerae bacterium]|nr:hypothetical protein [Phycisphaerae bacterium]
MMTSGTIILRPRPAAAWRARRPWRAAVQVEGAETAGLSLVRVQQRAGAAGARATFEWTSRSADFGNARRLANRGSRIRARIVRSSWPGGIADWPVFDGHLSAVRVEFDGGRRRVLLDAFDGVTHRHGGTRLVGRHGVGADDSVAFIDAARLIFNRDGRPTRSLSEAEINGRLTYVCDERPGGGAFWSVADAINYLLAVHLASDERIALPSRQRVESVCGQVRPRSLELTGAGLLESLEKLADLAGAGFAIEPLQSLLGGAGWRMRWFGRGGDRIVVMRHQRAGASMNPTATNIAGGRLGFDHDDARHVWIGLGERERVESTFSLVAGWDPGLESGDHRTFTRQSAGFAAVRDVYRRWVLNESGDWSVEPFSRGPAANLADLFGGATLLRPRRLLPCLSSDDDGRSRGVVVEVSYDSGASWRRHPGRVEVLDNEAGVRIADDPLPPDYWQAAVAGTLAVRVTATLESDRRLRVERTDPVRPSGRRTVEHVVDLPGRFARGRVDAGSQFAGGPADEADDRGAAAAMLDELIARHPSAATGGRLELPWLSATWQVGDRVRGIGGAGLSFAAGDADQPREPLIATVTHDLEGAWQTVLELSLEPR